MLVTLGPRDRVVSAGARVLEHERVREALNAVRFCLEGLSVRIARLGLRLRADHVLGAGEGQEIAELGGVDHHTSAHARPPALIEMNGEYRVHTIAARLDADGFRPEQDAKTAVVDSRRGHRREHVEGDAGLEGQASDPAPPGIGMALAGQRRRQPAVVVADCVAQRVVAARPAEALDVVVLVESRDALGGELAADPVGLLEEDDSSGGGQLACGSERGGYAASAAADDEDVARDLVDAPVGLHVEDGAGGISARTNGHHVEAGRHAPRYSRFATSVSRTPAAGPASETWPDSRTYARSASSSAMEAFCSTSRIVRPRSGRVRIVRAISATTMGASPSDGSSSSRYFGLAMRPRAMASICCSPPEGEPPSWVRRSRRRGKGSYHPGQSAA